MSEHRQVLNLSDGQYHLTSDADAFRHLDTTPGCRNRFQILTFYQAWCSLLADSPLNSVRGVSSKPRVVFRNFTKHFHSQPLKLTITDYSALAHEIVRNCTLYGEGSSTGPFLPSMRDTPVFREYHVWWKTERPDLLSYILSFLWFGKKLRYEDPDLNSTAFRGWEGVENRLSDLELDSHVTNDLRVIVAELVKPAHIDDFRPKFGPGAVSEKDIRGKISKANNLGYHPRLDRAFFTGVYSNFGLSVERGLSPERVIPDPESWRQRSRVCGAVSELRFVPKDVSKARSICMEPNSFMFGQQGFLPHFLESMKQGLCARFVNLADQSRNRELGKYGSYTGDIDTIDLSSASDSVSVELVRRIMPRSILYYLLATRTSKVRLPSGEIRSVKKFAPMGSALCFPTQCVIFTACVVYAAMQHYYGKDAGEYISQDVISAASVRTVIDRFLRQPQHVWSGTWYQPASVYGDDICVDSQLTSRLHHLLTQLGFEVNLSKSFRASQCFRETCGGYYFNGHDVTPLYYRVERRSRRIDARAWTTLVGAANNAFAHKRWNYRRLCIQLLQFADCAVRRRSVGFTTDPDKGGFILVKSVRYTNYRKRYNVDWQRDEVEVTLTCPSKYRKASPNERDALEAYLYMQWWAGRAGIVAESESFSTLRHDTSGSRLRPGWTPVEE